MIIETMAISTRRGRTAGLARPGTVRTRAFLSQIGPRAKRLSMAAAALLLVLLSPAEPRAEGRVYLLMVEQAGCIYCLRWDREVGTAYPKSRQGRFAPLVRRPLDHPEVRRLTPPAVYTPTFVVIDGAREVGRIVGYPGADFFWEELDQILGRAGFEAEPVPSLPSARRAGVLE